MSSTSYIDPVLKQHGLQAAFDEACSTVRRQADEFDSWWNPRFFERRVLDGGRKKLLSTTKVQITRAYDLQACEPEVPQVLFCDKDGGLCNGAHGLETARQCQCSSLQALRKRLKASRPGCEAEIAEAPAHWGARLQKRHPKAIPVA